MTKASEVMPSQFLGKVRSITCNYNIHVLYRSFSLERNLHCRDFITTILSLPTFNVEWRHKSFSFLAAKLWNSLPTYVRNAKDISTFQCLLKKQVFK